MKLNTRMKITFATIIVLPLLLTVIAFFMIGISLINAEKGAELVLTAGPLAAELAGGAGDRAKHYVNQEALIEDLPRKLRKGDCVLVKASRGMRFDAISEAIKELKL